MNAATMAGVEPFELFAIRYGRHTGRRATDNFIGAGGFKAHIDRIGARAANNALGGHCLQGRVVNLGVERDELGHDREQTLSP